MKIGFLVVLSIAAGIIGAFAAFILLGAGICGDVPAMGGATISIICGAAIVGISQFFGRQSWIPSVFYCLPLAAMAALAIDQDHKLAAAASATIVSGVTAGIFFLRGRIRRKRETVFSQDEKTA